MRVGVIGAGLGGVASAVYLRRAGIEDLTVFEKAEGPGGVWWYNTYPGCEVDVDSQVYSYSFMPWPWTRTHASQAELQQYIQAVIDRFGLASSFRYGVSVRAARWVDDACGYELDTSVGPVGPFDLLVSGVGMLSDPAVPKWAGGEAFRGPVFHTSRYRHDVELTGRRVALVGTGSTACQLAPRLAEVVDHLDVYQREAGYVLPKRTRHITDKERAWFRRVPLTQKLVRWNLLYRGNRAARAFRIAHPEQARIRQFHYSYLERKVKDPEVRGTLTPAYPYGCKRPVFTSEFYTIFNRPNVTLVPQAVSRLTERGVVAADGTERTADAVILATGFRATEYLSTLDVVGSKGCRLREVWDEDPWAFLGMTVPGFPNFFMLYGPNTNGGWSICGQLERQSRVIARVARRMQTRGLTAFDTRSGIANYYDRWVQRSIRRRRDSNQAGCHNYFHTASGKNVTQWPYSAYFYGALARFLPCIGLVYSRRHRASETSPIGHPA